MSSLAELAEIDENLIRAELTPVETAMHFTRRKELYEKLHPKTKHGGAPPKKGRGGGAGKQRSQDESFVSETAKKSGKGRSTVQRDSTRGNKVKVLADVLGTSLDQGKELDAKLASLWTRKRQVGGCVRDAARLEGGKVCPFPNRKLDSYSGIFPKPTSNLGRRKVANLATLKEPKPQIGRQRTICAWPARL